MGQSLSVYITLIVVDCNKSYHDSHDNSYHYSQYLSSYHNLNSKTQKSSQFSPCYSHFPVLSSCHPLEAARDCVGSCSSLSERGDFLQRRGPEMNVSLILRYTVCTIPKFKCW